MDILKKVLKDQSACKITPAGMNVCGKDVQTSQLVRFKRTDTKEYTLEQVLFYIVNKDQKYTTYISLCKERGVGKIYYTDQKIVLEEIEGSNEVPISVKADGVEFRYIGRLDYGHLSQVLKRFGKQTTASNYIIVPQSLSSPINLNNVKQFFEEGKCECGEMNGLNKIDMKMDEFNFVVVDDVEEFTSEEWRNVAAVFLDGSKWQTSDWTVANIADILNAVPVFHLMKPGVSESKCFKGYSVMEIPIKNEFVSKTNLDFIKRKIMKYALNK